MKIDSDPDFDDSAEATKAPESRQEPVQEEKVEEEAPKETPEVEAADTAEIEPDKPEPGDSDKVKKDKERFARNWQEMQKRNEEAKAKVAAAEERARKAEEEAAVSSSPRNSLRDRRGFTVEDYDNYATAQEMKATTVAKNAREEAVLLRQEVAEKQFLSKWQATQAEMVEANPDLANPTTALNKEVEKLLREPDNVYITRPTGLKAAVAQAKANLSSESISAIQAENEKLKQELNRLEKLGAIPGRDGAMKRVGQKGFEEMTLEQQRAQLLRQSEELDAESMRFETPISGTQHNYKS